MTCDPERIEIVDVAATDVVIATIPKHFSMEQAHHLHRTLMETFGFSENERRRVLIKTDELLIDVFAESEAAS